ncbi:hypothetical protein EYF80_042611 [Liparis tanakae]|uniref:Uncharacterized protein n=1 Tax=Liparis tanakae TaxID=230148 RepID=A0A4Z2G0W0_9TELE|nr:hypothetical protein EYF80_042611 [Liparis tanakae]
MNKCLSVLCIIIIIMSIIIIIIIIIPPLVFNVWLSSHIWLFRLVSSQLIDARCLDQRQRASFSRSPVFPTAACLYESRSRLESSPTGAPASSAKRAGAPDRRRTYSRALLERCWSKGLFLERHPKQSGVQCLPPIATSLHYLVRMGTSKVNNQLVKQVTGLMSQPLYVSTRM